MTVIELMDHLSHARNPGSELQLVTHSSTGNRVLVAVDDLREGGDVGEWNIDSAPIDAFRDWGSAS